MIKDNIFRNKKYITVSLFLVFFTTIIFGMEIWKKIPTFTTHVGNNNAEQFIYNIPIGDIISQDFFCERNFDYITLSFSDHDQHIEGKTVITVSDKNSGDLVSYNEIDNKDIHYGELVKIEWDSLNKGGQTYNLSFYVMDIDEVSLGIYGYPVEDEEKAAIVDGERSEYAVSIGIHSYTNVYRQLVTFILFVTVVMLVLLLWVSYKVQPAEEKLFLCAVVPLGIVYLSFLSINPVHDGGTHLAKVYHYSNVIMGKGEMDYGGHVYLSEDEAQCFEGLYADIYRENALAQEYWEIRNDFRKRTEADTPVESHEYRETSASSFWEYFPGVIGMTLGRMFNGSARCNILLTKIFFFIFYAAIGFWAIRITPYMKTCFSFTLLLPMSIYQAVGVTYDSVVIVVTILFLSFWLKAREHGLSRAEWMGVLVLSYLLGCYKGGFYALILLLLILVPAEYVGGKIKKSLLCLGSCLVAGAAILITSINAYLPYLQGMLGVYGGSGSTLLESGSGIMEMIPEKESVAYGIMFIIKEPLSCIKMVFHTLIEEADYYLGGLIGYRMAWSDRLIPWYVICIFIVLLVLGGIWSSGKLRNPLKMQDRFFCVVLIISEVLAFHLLMLIETPLGASTISGVQGRYFIGILPIILFALCAEIGTKADRYAKRLYLYLGFSEMLYIFYFIRIYFGIL